MTLTLYTNIVNMKKTTTRAMTKTASTHKFKSSAIHDISELDSNKVTIRFNSKPSVSYTYTVYKPDFWKKKLDEVIENEESVGKFINTSIRSKVLKLDTKTITIKM